MNRPLTSESIATTQSKSRTRAAFTNHDLSQPFTVWTRWRPALGQSKLGRVYCIIIDAKGRDWNELLVENGLARIYGTKTPLPDGRDSAAYVAHLKGIEAKAKREGDCGQGRG